MRCFLRGYEQKTGSLETTGRIKAHMDNGTVYLILFIALAAAAFIDLRTGKIPNWITLPTTATGLVFHTVMNGANGLAYSANGLATGFALLILLYAMGGLGAGDVKLVAAAGSFLGPSAIISAVWAAALVTGFYAVGLLIIRLGCGGTIRWIWSWMKSLLLLGAKPSLLLGLPTKANRLVLRYAPLFVIGTLMSLGLSFIG